MLKDYSKEWKVFDSFCEKGKIAIITSERVGYDEELTPCESFISIDRAKEIVKSLKEAISKAEAHKNSRVSYIPYEMKYYNRKKPKQND